ncbi:MAG: hypothetical protein R2727_10140 [Bacteroidales bacterium]
MKIISRVIGICVTLFIISLEWSCTGDNAVTLLPGLVEEIFSRRLQPAFQILPTA